VNVGEDDVRDQIACGLKCRDCALAEGHREPGVFERFPEPEILLGARRHNEHERRPPVCVACATPATGSPSSVGGAAALRVGQDVSILMTQAI
jgi:hypothetical protein